jgi:hypothetical protein
MIMSDKFMFTKYHVLILICLALTPSIFAQETLNKKFQLQWLKPQKITLNAGKTISLPLINTAHIDAERLIPFYFTQWEVPLNMEIQNFELRNIVYENISSVDLLDINPESIPTIPEVKLDAVSTRQISEAFLTVIPLVKDGNQFKKMISFEVYYTLKNTNHKGKEIKSTNNSVLATGTWYKIAVDTSGVYKLDRSFLNDLGIRTNQINPQNIQIFGNGGALLPYRIGDFRYDDLQENAIFIEGEADGEFDSGDFILFYAKGPESWKHNNTTESLSHVRNIYDDKAYYFIHVGSSPGKRIQNASLVEGSPVLTLQNFDDYWVYEKDTRNLFAAGQQWLGESFDIQNQRTFTHTFPNLDTSIPIRVKVVAAGISSSNTSFQLAVNGSNLSNFNINSVSGHTLAMNGQTQASTTVGNEQISLSLQFNNGGNSSAKAYLDYIEIIGKRNLVVGNKQFVFRNFATLNTTGIINFQIQNTTNIFKLWDITDPINVSNISNQGTGGSYTFNTIGGQLKEFVIVNSQDYYTPSRPSDYRVQNQNLHGLSDVDYLIITDESFTDEAETLAQYHRSQSGLTVEIIPLHQIYNEFGSGSKDITAIRDFVRHVYLNSPLRLKYILLYGDASFDFKNISNQTASVVPAFESINSFDMTSSFVTDDFYGIVSDMNEGDLDGYFSQTQDVAVSRIPFNTAQEAQAINAKLLNYFHSNSLGDWRNEVLMIADDSDANSDETLQISQESLADNVKINKPLVNVKKLWMDAYVQEVTAGGSRYPQVNNEINNQIEKGVLLIDYFGHGGEDGLSAERIIETGQIENWANIDNLNLLTVISCEFARFDNPYRPNTAGELVIRNPNGSAAHEIATAREVFINIGQYFNHNLVPRLLAYTDNSFSISDHLRMSKNSSISSKQRYFIFSFGDPAMKLALPKPDVRLTHMNGTPVTQSLDTIKALSHISFDGIVTLSNGNIDSNFNGEVYLTVFDKPMDRQTLNNDGNAEIMTFDTQDSKIFRGRASVTNGQFHIEFVAPQDIRIAYGYGKLSFYAHNGSTDRGGYNTDIVIGGINYDAATDNTGPTIRLYMNDTSFIDGGNTNESPLLMAFMEDENGINTSFSSVDHDITAVLDDDQQNPYILNDYYITDVDDYTKGSLEYRLRDLTIGSHVIQLKAYDTYNNPSEATLHFVVVDDAELILEHVLNYPNPFVNYTEFWFSHNKPNEALEVQVQIYTVSGKLVKTINQNIQSSGSLSRDITWDGLDDFGQKIGKGVYVFKLSVSAPNSDLKAEKFEKLVILQ